MSLLNDTYKASFAGAAFSVRKTTTAGGSKTVLHEFPNSDKQNIESLGLKPRTFTIDGFIHGTGYERNKNKLLDALESGETGVLVHPFFGRLDKIICRTFSLVESFEEFGIASFTMVFAVSNDIGTPKGATNTASFINGKNSALQNALNSDLSNGFSVSNLRNSITAASDTLNRVFDSIDESTKIVTQSIQAMDEFSALINDFSTNINDLARKPQALADSLQNISLNINGLYAVIKSTTSGNSSPDDEDAAKKTLDVFESMFGFDNDIEAAANTTSSRIEINLNNNLLKQNQQSSSLGYAYLNASQMDFATVSDIDAVAGRLEAQFQKVLSNQDNIENLTDLSANNVDIDTSSLDAMQALRDATQSFLDNAKLTTNKVIDVRTAEMSASLLTFQYYGELDLENDIIELNESENVSFFSDSVKVLGL